MSEPTELNDSTAMAIAVVTALRTAGFADVVLSPGSRSAAVAIALHQADQQGLVRLHVRIDERTAGFLALGLAKGGRRPVAVVTTSGSAVAHLHPAMLEALHVGERIVVLSADRPAAMRGTGANQTTEQAGLFGPRVASIDVAPDGQAEAVHAIEEAARRDGPTQINLQFADPLLPSSLPIPLPAVDLADVSDSHRSRRQPRDATPIELGPRTVVVAGDDAGPPARMLAQDSNWPLLAEPTSGSRTGTHALRTYRLLLDTDLATRIERVVVTGHPTLSRPITKLISRPDIEVISVAGPGGVHTDPGRVATKVGAVPLSAGRDAGAWIEEWRARDAETAARVDELAADADGLPLRVAAAVAAAVEPGTFLFVGSSQPIRDLDVMAPVYPPGEHRFLMGNRGLAGIDGSLSTAIGATLARPSTRAIAYVGDLTFLHDANALVIGPDEPRPDLTLVVANDDGGAIFSTLEQGAPALRTPFERVFGTPHHASIESLCAATQTAYTRIEDAEQLAVALAQPVSGIRVLEVPISRASRRLLDERLRRLV